MEIRKDFYLKNRFLYHFRQKKRLFFIWFYACVFVLR